MRDMERTFVQEAFISFLYNFNNGRSVGVSNNGPRKFNINSVIDISDDVIENENGKKSLYRIYRDVRFSKDKVPFKTHFGGSLRRATKARRGSYYFHLEPGNSFAGGGFWEPSPEDLKRIREEFSADPDRIRKLLKAKTFKSYFGELYGEQLKTTPKGFQPDDPAIDLLRYKQFAVIRHFTDKEVMAVSFLKELNATFKAMRPFLDYMSEVLTTDINGESLL
ncbi:MAG: DUF2461 domain-containing protein [Sphingobacteriia bacterium]|nr:DUF2461 domain-containing protein [Sphingobacteriia bacterium]